MILLGDPSKHLHQCIRCGVMYVHDQDMCIDKLKYNYGKCERCIFK